MHTPTTDAPTYNLLLENDFLHPGAWLTSYPARSPFYRRDNGSIGTLAIDIGGLEVSFLASDTQGYCVVEVLDDSSEGDEVRCMNEAGLTDVPTAAVPSAVPAPACTDPVGQDCSESHGDALQQLLTAWDTPASCSTCAYAPRPTVSPAAEPKWKHFDRLPPLQSDGSQSGEGPDWWGPPDFGADFSPDPQRQQQQDAGECAVSNDTTAEISHSVGLPDASLPSDPTAPVLAPADSESLALNDPCLLEYADLIHILDASLDLIAADFSRLGGQGVVLSPLGPHETMWLPWMRSLRVILTAHSAKQRTRHTPCTWVC